MSNKDAFGPERIVKLRGRCTTYWPFGDVRRIPTSFKVNMQADLYAKVWASIKERGIGYDPYNHQGSKL